MPAWLALLGLAILLVTLPLATLLAWHSGRSTGAWRAAVLIAVAEGLVMIAAAAWLSHPGEPLFWVLALLGIVEIVAVLRLWRMFSRL